MRASRPAAGARTRWCASPLSGLGTALGLTGAAALADALGAGRPLTDAALSAALASFERAMRPAATAAQRLLPGRVAMVAPRRRWGIRANAAVMNLAQSRLALPLLALAARGRGHDDV